MAAASGIDPYAHHAARTRVAKPLGRGLPVGRGCVSVAVSTATASLGRARTHRRGDERRQVDQRFGGLCLGRGGGHHGDSALQLGDIEAPSGRVAFQLLVELLTLGVAQPHVRSIFTAVP